MRSNTLFLMSMLGCNDEIDPCDQPNAGNFDIDHLLEVDLIISPEDWDTVRNHRRSFVTEFIGDCMDRPFESNYPTRPAQLTIDGEFLASVGIRKKGFIGSQSDTKPSLKINLDEYLEDAELFCTDNMTFNNGVQGPSVIRQCLAYAMFDAAGIVAPRCNFARLTVNGRDLGIYAQVEPIKPLFMRRRFGNDDGHHYEGTLSDFSIRRLLTFDPKTDETDQEYSPILPVIDLLDSTDDEQFAEELGNHIQLKSFYRFWAMELLTGHWDGYNGNRNNFHIYQDSASGKITFIPWGLDDTFDVELLEETQIYSQSRLAQRILSIPSMRSDFETELIDILNTVWDEDAISSRLRKMGDLLHDQMDPEIFQLEIDETRAFIVERRQQVLDMLEASVEFEDDAPYCLVESGSVEATFETTWGSNATENLLGTGNIDISMNFDGDVTFYNTGVLAGPADTEGTESYDELILSGEIDPSASAILIPYFSYPSELGVDGASIDVDDVRSFGRLYYTDDSGFFGEIAVLYGGTLEWENMSTDFGDTVSGSINSGIYSWEPIE